MMTIQELQLDLTIGDVTITPVIRDGDLQSLGTVLVGGMPLRNPVTRFLPWFDTYEGDLFRRFRWFGIETRGATTVLRTQAISDPDTMFRERRDSSGDLCFRNVSWDAAPLEAEFAICLQPVQTEIDGRAFTGFKYWFEYESIDTPIHRLIDRQTWELGGHLDDVTICLRNWLTGPRVRLSRDTEYSTVGLYQFAGLLPGNLWGRWTLLPSFDMQYGSNGVLLGWFDEVSLIRTVIETNPGEDALRCMDLHGFTQSTSVRTNPKTILYCPDVLDDTDALNLWTRVSDLEQAKACQQFNINLEPQGIVFVEDKWVNYQFDSSYDAALDVAAEFGADYLFIDSIWENEETYREMVAEGMPAELREGTIVDEVFTECLCATLDYRVAQHPGGEAGLKTLCDRAKDKGVKIMSWMAAHLSSDSPHFFRHPELGHGANGVFAAKESGRHPDTGYPSGCWPINLNAPIADYLRNQVLGICERTGLSGFLWDSFCNLGWWQVDYSDGSMRPQFDKMAGLFADFTNAGIQIYPEALVTFANTSMCGLHGGNVYADDLLGFSYNTSISHMWAGLEPGEYWEHRILRGQEPIDILFRSFAHKRIPLMNLQRVPREEWHPERVDEIKALFAAYKANRQLMQRRTVLKGDHGVLWQNDTDTALFFSFQEQPFAGTAVHAVTGEAITCRLGANQPYLMSAAGASSLFLGNERDNSCN